MAKQTINIGTIVGDGTGDGLRDGAIKINSNFDELYSAIQNNQLPSQSSNAGKFLTTNGSALSWGTPVVPTDLSQLTDNENLLDIIPPQVNNAGRVLTTNGTSLSWVSVPSPIPSQAGNVGRFLTTNGSAVSWGSPYPAQAGNQGRFLTTDGTTVSWGTLAEQINLVGLADVAINTPVFGQVLKYNGSTWYNANDSIGDLLTLDNLTDVTITNPTDGQVLKYDAGNNRWVNAADSTGTGSAVSRNTASAIASSLAAGATGNVTITGYKGYVLYKIQTSAAAWVRIYADTASRTADASRAEGADPNPSAGVIAEVITTGAQTILLTPGVIGFNNETVPNSNIQVAVTNKSGATTSITVTLTLVALEG